MGRFLLGLVMLGLLTQTTFAKDDPAKLTEQAKSLARDGDLSEAAQIYAAAFEAARKKKDLQAQEKVARSMQSELRRGLTKASDRAEAYRSTLLTLLEELDPKRNGAFLSAGGVAHELLFEASRSGVHLAVGQAAGVAAPWAKRPKVGAYAAAMADYAAGLLAVAADDHAAACRKLQAALDKMVSEGWAIAALHVGTELAAAYAAIGDKTGAAAALEKAGRALTESGDYAGSVLWRRMVQKRLEGADKEVLAPFLKAVEPLEDVGQSKSSNTSSGQSPRGGSRDRSKVGDAWKKLSGRKPFVTATRVPEGFHIRQGFDKKFGALHAVKPGVTHHTDGGIALAFWSGGVRLQHVVMEGQAGDPGVAAQPLEFQFFSQIARGETWGVSKTGEVSIVPK